MLVHVLQIHMNCSVVLSGIPILKIKTACFMKSVTKR